MTTWGDYLCRGVPESAPVPASRRDLFATLPTELVRVIFEFVLPTDKSATTLTLTGHLREKEMDYKNYQMKWLETNHPKFGQHMLGETITVREFHRESLLNMGFSDDDRTDFYQEGVSWNWKERKYSEGDFSDSVDRFSLLEATGSVGAVCKSFNRLLQTFPFVLSYVARLRFLSSFKACWEAKAELDVWSIDMGDIFQREPFGPPPVPVAVCPPEDAKVAAFMAQLYDGDPYKNNASINNNPPVFVAQLLCLPQEMAFSRVSMCCFDIDLWITILAEELAKREADTDRVFTREIEIGATCRLHRSNDSHPWYSNQFLSQASREAFVKIDDFMLARAASPDDYEMINPLVCRECRRLDTDCSSNYDRTEYIRRENECEHCHSPIGPAMVRVCFDSCSDKIGRLCSCLQPIDKGEYVDPGRFYHDRERDCCGMVCASCLPKLNCKKCDNSFFSKFCPYHECVKPQERPH